MAVHSRGARRAFASLNIRDSDNDFTVLLDRSSVAPSSVPPPPRSEARPRLALRREEPPRREEPAYREEPTYREESMFREEPAFPPPRREEPREEPRAMSTRTPPEGRPRIERTPVPPPPRREAAPAPAPAPASADRPSEARPVSMRALRTLRQQLDDSPTGRSARRRQRRATIAMLAIGLLAFGASIGAIVESVVGPHGAGSAQPPAAIVAAPAEQCATPELAAPATETPSAIDLAPPVPVVVHRHHHRVTDPARAAGAASAPSSPSDTNATADDYAAAADALEKAKQETTLP